MAWKLPLCGFLLSVTSRRVSVRTGSPGTRATIENHHCSDILIRVRSLTHQPSIPQFEKSRGLLHIMTLVTPPALAEDHSSSCGLSVQAVFLFSLSSKTVIKSVLPRTRRPPRTMKRVSFSPSNTAAVITPKNGMR